MKPLCLLCGHGQTAHEHFRRGSDCGLCPCRRYRRSSRWVSPTGLLGAVGLVSVAVAGVGVVDAVLPGGLG